MKNKVSFFILILSVPVCLFTLLGYLGNIYWIFDLCAHFKLQYAIILLVPCLFFLIYRQFYIAAIFFLFFAMNLYEVSRLYFHSRQHTPEQFLKISSINLLASNRASQAVADYIHTINPDVLILLEFNERWQGELEAVLEAYPYKKMVPRSDNFGIAMFSKIEVQSTTELNLSPASVPSLLATLCFNGQSLQILATHPVPPVGQQAFIFRNTQLASIASMKSTLGDYFVIIGDLNTSSYAPNFKRMLADMQLKDSREGFGILPTWPVGFFPLMVTIDHCLVSQKMTVKERTVGKDIGSDHLPIYVEVGF